MLLQIREDRRKTAAKILLWVTMTVQPLSLSELSTAIDIVVEPSASFSRDEVMRDKVSHCGYFLTVKNDEVSLIHRSAKDYLLRKTPDSNPELEFFRLKEEVGNLEIARKCFDYLQNGALALCVCSKVDLSSNSSHLKAFPLLLYAALHWPHHSKSLARSEHVVNPLHPFYDKKSLTRESWLKTYWAATRKGSPPDVFTPLHLASWFGILPLAENIFFKRRLVDTQKLSFIFNKRDGINKRDSYGRTALWGAAVWGHEALVHLLLEKGAEIKSKGELGSGSRVTALFCAATMGHIAILQLLLKKGANVNDDSEIVGSFRGTALFWAVLNGNKAVALLLIENGANLKAKCEISGLRLTALMAAVGNGHDAIAKLLLEKGAEVDEKIEEGRGWSGSTALTIAIQNGNEAALQLLLENGANFKAKIEINGSRVPVLYFAATIGNRAIVQLLLEKGVEVDELIEVGSGNRVTALVGAALNGNEAVVQLLLNKEANIKANLKGGMCLEQWRYL